MKPITAWAIVKPPYTNTIPPMMEDRCDLIDWFEDEMGQDWGELQDEGYRAVRVRIEEIEEGE